MLRRGVQHVGTSPGFALLFQRLEAGGAVRMLGLGTSVSGVAGGCTHSLLPYCESCCGTRAYGARVARRSPRRGFLRRAFEWLNRTWPNREHRLYNGARPGAGGLANFIGCLRSWVPVDTDLFFLEVGGTANSMASVERLARLIHRLRPPSLPPAIFVIDMWNYRWPNRSEPPAEGFVRPSPVLALARYYGWPVVSEHDAIYHEFIASMQPNAKLPGAGWRHQRKMWRDLKPDLVHPTSMGEMLYGDLVIYGLWLSYQMWLSLGPRTAQQLQEELLAHPLVPPLSISPSQDTEESLVCFTFDKRRLEGDPTLAGPDAHLIDVEGGLAPNVKYNKGWQFVKKETQSVRANKPGLKATSAGAELELQILPFHQSFERANSHATNSSFLGVGIDIPLGEIKVALRHLVSYERQGVANLTCFDGCTCGVQLINAHEGSRKESIDSLHEFVVRIVATPPSCSLRVRIVDASASGGFEFKITRLVVSHAQPSRGMASALDRGRSSLEK